MNESNHLPEELGEYRNYLMTIAHLQIEPQLREKLDASDIVHQTLLEAHEQQDRFRGQSRPEFAAWLKQILLHNLLDVVRAFRRAKRDVAREQSLDAACERSTIRLAALMVADQSTPSMKMERDERGMQLAEALAKLPEAQREALVLQHWHNWSVSQIADHLGRSRTAVAGLLKRGLAKLREELDA